MFNHFSHLAVGPLNTSWGPRVTFLRSPTPKVPSEILDECPRLEGILSSIETPANLYWETWPPDPAVREWGWTQFDLWPEESQRFVDSLWTPELDDWVDSLIDVYGSNWHNALPLVATRDQPDLVRQLQEFYWTLSDQTAETVRYAVNFALSHGAWLRTTRRRSWAFPSPQWCHLCGAGYYGDTVRYYLLRRWGSAGICPRCLFLAACDLPMDSMDSAVRSTPSIDEALESLRRLAAVAQVIPPQSFRESLPHPGLGPISGTRLAAALICTPDAKAIREIAGGVSWLRVLQTADLVGEARRAARGTLCIAADGHPCRSLAERSIDDWLSRHDVAHDVEPYWPGENELNPDGRLRADWRLPDGTLVEYAGLNQEDYNAKIERKRALASKTGTKLIVIIPEDLLSLEAIFRSWISSRSSSS